MKKFIGNTLLVLASIFLTLLVAEALLRVVPLGFSTSAGGDRGYFSQFDPELGWAPVPSTTQYHTVDGFSVRVHQNSLGLRSSTETALKNDGTRHRVIVLGDSYVWGFGAEQEDIFTEPSTHGRDDLELINLGVSGYGTDQELLLYRRLGKKIEADEVVLVFTTYNDISNNMSRKQYGYYKPVFSNNGKLVVHDSHVRDRTVRSVGLWFRNNSRVVQLVGTAALNIRYWWQNRNGDELSAMRARGRVLTADDVREPDMEGVDLTIALIAAIRDEAARQGATFSVIFIPYKPNILALKDKGHPLVPVLEERLGAEGIACIDPYPEFLEAAKSGTSLFNTRDNHFNAAGHKLFSRFFTDDKLKKQASACN